MKILFSNGDSHTAGNELEHAWQISCYEKAWPNVLASKLNLKNINIAKAGASNYQIFRTTRDWIFENTVLNKNYKSEDLVVFIMWSGFDREEIYFPDTNVLDNMGFSSVVSLYNTELKAELKNLQESMVSFQDDIVSGYRSLNLMYCLSLFLESLNIKYHFINGLYYFLKIENVKRNHRLYDSYNNLLKMMGNRSSNFMGFYNHEDVFFNYMKDLSGIEVAKHSKYSHYGEDGHIHWANVVYKFYFERKII